jgi:uncharacterized protein
MRIGDREVTDESVETLCRKWMIRNLHVFGSAQAGRPGPDSDIDLLAEFESGERWSLMDLVEAQQEFSDLLGRDVDLVDRDNLRRSRNQIRRDAILNSAELIYRARPAVPPSLNR